MAHPHSAGVPGETPEVPAAPAVRAGAAPARPSTYRELLADEANGPAPGRLADYLSGYRFDGGGAAIPTPATLRDQTVTLSDCQPMAFLALVQGPSGNSEVAVLHRMMRFMDLPGEEPTGFHDKVLGLLGDRMPHQYPVVDVLSTTCFHLVGAPVRVPTTADLYVLVPTWEDPNAPLGHFVETDPETEVVRLRNVQLIPGHYASCLSTARDLVRKLYTRSCTDTC